MSGHEILVEIIKAAIGASIVLFWNWLAYKDLIYFKAWILGAQHLHGTFRPDIANRLISKYEAMGLDVESTNTMSGEVILIVSYGKLPKSSKWDGK